MRTQRSGSVQSKHLFDPLDVTSCCGLIPQSTPRRSANTPKGAAFKLLFMFGFILSGSFYNCAATEKTGRRERIFVLELLMLNTFWSLAVRLMEISDIYNTCSEPACRVLHAGNDWGPSNVEL